MVLATEAEQSREYLEMKNVSSFCHYFSFIDSHNKVLKDPIIGHNGINSDERTLYSLYNLLTNYVIFEDKSYRYIRAYIYMLFDPNHQTIL